VHRRSVTFILNSLNLFNYKIAYDLKKLQEFMRLLFVYNRRSTTDMHITQIISSTCFHIFCWSQKD